MKRITFYILILCFITSNALALDVIPGLKVFGGTTRAAYGNGVNPTICIVDTLDENAAMAQETRNGVTVLTGGLEQFIEDDTNINTTFCTALDTPFDCCTGNGTGNCVDNKLIIFETSGVIEDFDQWDLDGDYITIAGQTAPSPGISIHGVHLDINGDHTVMQHIRMRVGDNPAGALPYVRNCIESYGTYNIFDHCSFSWAPDGNTATTNAYSSISNSIMSEGLEFSIHSEDLGARHSCGHNMATGTNYSSVINNLFAHNSWRNPMIDTFSGTAHLLVANNLIYNPYSQNIFMNGADSSLGEAIIVGNISVGGIETATGTKDAIPDWMYSWGVGSKFFIDDNKVCDEYGGTCDTQTGPTDWDHIDIASGYEAAFAAHQAETIPFSYPTGYTPMAVGSVEAYVLANVGARPADRDEVDLRIVADVTEVAGARDGYLIDTIEYVNADCTAQYYVGAVQVNCCTGSGTGTCRQNPEGGWPTLAANTDTHTDLPATPHADDDSDGYTNLEEWIHSFSAIVEGTLLEVQNVSPTDGGEGISITASATWYYSAYVDDVELWLDSGACDGTPDDGDLDCINTDDCVGDESSADADFTYDMSTLVEATTYCLTLQTNYGAEQGDWQQFEFTTTTGPPAPPAGLATCVYSASGLTGVYDDQGATVGE